MHGLLVVSGLILSVISAPAPSTDEDFIYANGFMARFGYIPQQDGMFESMVKVEDALREVQRFGGIPQTGRLDHRTMQLMKSPRCGIPDLVNPPSKVGSGSRTKRFVLSPMLGWKKRHLTYYVSNWSPQLGSRGVRSELDKAFAPWAKSSGLNFQEAYSSTADIVVSFHSGEHGDGNPFDGRGTILAHAFPPGKDLGGDIHFDADEIWKINPEQFEDDVDFFSVAVHEIGHTLGLYHSTDRSSVMFPYYKRFDSASFALGYDDVMGMYELYYTRTSKKGSNSGGDFGRNPTTRRTVKTTTRRPHVTHRHRPHYKPPPTARTASDTPDICQGHFSAVAYLRGELFIFKEQYVWRMAGPGHIAPGYPVHIDRMFHGQHHNIVSVDAVYVRITDYNLVFFSGDVYWVYDGNYFVSGPRPLSDYGLPNYVRKVDAVMVWGGNHKTYIFSGNECWGFDEFSRRVVPEQTKSVELFRGVPHNLDSAMTWADGVTYFFKDNYYWAFNNTMLRTDPSYPNEAAHFWLGCVGRGVKPSNLRNEKQVVKNPKTSGSNSSIRLRGLEHYFWSFFFVLLIYQNNKFLT